MKTTLDENGKLSIKPENGLECYALKLWWEDFNGKNFNPDRKAFIHLDIGEPEEEYTA